MDRRTRQQLKIFAIISVMAAIGGGIYGMVIVALSGGGGGAYILGAMRGVYTGLVIGLVLTGWELFYVNARTGNAVRDLPFLTNVLVRSLFYLIVISFGLWSGAALFPGEEAGPVSVAEILVQLGFSAFIAIAVNFIMAIGRLLGPTVFRNFLTGRYHKPKQERRILLFADLVGSTRLTERLGDVAFHSFLSAVYRDLTGPVLETRGVIHKYVGDEMIVSWEDSPANRRRARDCALGMLQALRLAAGRYEPKYGSAPSIRIGIHAGDVVVGEMGEVRQEIVYLGDAMNVAARLVDECRDQGRVMMMSAALLAGQGENERDGLEPMGEIDIRGRSGRLAVWALTETAAP